MELNIVKATYRKDVTNQLIPYEVDVVAYVCIRNGDST